MKWSVKQIGCAVISLMARHDWRWDGIDQENISISTKLKQFFRITTQTIVNIANRLLCSVFFQRKMHQLLIFPLTRAPGIRVIQNLGIIIADGNLMKACCFDNSLLVYFSKWSPFLSGKKVWVIVSKHDQQVFSPTTAGIIPDPKSNCMPVHAGILAGWEISDNIGDKASWAQNKSVLNWLVSPSWPFDHAPIALVLDPKDSPQRVIHTEKSWIYIRRLLHHHQAELMYDRQIYDHLVLSWELVLIFSIKTTNPSMICSNKGFIRQGSCSVGRLWHRILSPFEQ